MKTTIIRDHKKLNQEADIIVLELSDRGCFEFTEELDGSIRIRKRVGKITVSPKLGNIICVE